MRFFTRRGPRFTALAATLVLLTSACGDGGEAGNADGSIDRLETVIVQSAGGGTDTLARAILERFVAPRLDDARLVTRNEEGDAGLLGLGVVERSSPDEAVIGFVNTTTLYAQYARGDDAPVDMLEMTPIAGYGVLPSVVVVSAELGIDSFEELVKYYQENQEPYGGTSPGGASELSANLLKSEYGLEWNEFVAYDGSGELMAAIARGEVPAGNLSATSAADALAANTGVPVLNLGSEPASVIPDVPTSASLGLPPIGSGENTRLILASSNMNPDLRDRIVAVFEDALTSEDARAWSEENDIGLDYQSPDEVSATLEAAFEEIKSVPDVESILSGE